ncbi:MAG: hypothetical protein NTX98_03925 [Candidatus Doudnabacteria bacterium]|nr:hypothetical protein [Candidatus Doudnabacteria bacterium]
MANKKFEQAISEMEKYSMISRLSEFTRLAEMQLEQLRAKGEAAGQYEKKEKELGGFVSVARTVLQNINNIAPNTLADLIKRAGELGLKQEV